MERHEETQVTQQPGYSGTRQVIRDVAAERTLWYLQVRRVLWTAAGIVEIFLGFRFILKLLAANPNSGFAVVIYDVGGRLASPFQTLFPTPTFGSSSFELNTLIAMAVYALIVWLLVRIIHIAAERPRVRTETRSTREQLPNDQVPN